MNSGFHDHSVFVSGWGIINRKQEAAASLRYTKVTMKGMANQWHINFGGRLSDRGVCLGDSGGKFTISILIR